MLCNNLHEELQLIFIIRYKPVVFMYKCYPTLCSVICGLDSLYQLSATTQLGWSFHEPGSSVRNFWSIFIFRKKRRVFFVIRSAKFKRSFFRAHLGRSSPRSLSSPATIRRFMSSALLGQKKPMPLIPQRGTRADQRNYSVRLSHLRSYLPLEQGV